MSDEVETDTQDDVQLDEDTLLAADGGDADGDDEGFGPEDDFEYPDPDEEPDVPDAESDEETASSEDDQADLIDTAKELGLDDEQIAAFGDKLPMVLSLLQGQQASQPEGESAEEQQQAAVDDAEADDDVSDEFKFEEPDDFDPEVNRFVEHVNKTLKAQRDEIASMKHALRQRAAEDMADRIDHEFRELGDTWKGVFGSGTRHAIKPDSKEYEARAKVVDQMNAIALGLSQQGKKVPPPAELFRQAVHAAFPEHVEKSVRQSVKDQVRGRRGSMGHRPQSRNGHQALPHGERRALLNVRKQLEEWGVGDDL